MKEKEKIKEEVIEKSYYIVNDELKLFKMLDGQAVFEGRSEYYYKIVYGDCQMKIEKLDWALEILEGLVDEKI